MYNRSLTAQLGVDWERENSLKRRKKIVSREVSSKFLRTGGGVVRSVLITGPGYLY